MKKIISFALVFVTIVGLAGKSMAQMPPAVIGVVDLVKIQEEAAVFKDLNRQRDNWIVKYRDEVKKEEETLKKKQAELDEIRKDENLQKDAKKVESYNKKVTEMNQAVMKSTMMARARGEAVSEATREALTRIQSEYLNKIIAEIAQKNGVNIVMAGTQVLFYEEKMELTKDVLVTLDKTITSVKMPDPKVKEPAGK